MARTFRVLKDITNLFQKEVKTTEVVWEGADIHDLSRRFPQSRVMGADALGWGSIEDGFISWSHRFELKIDGEWEEIDDPRHYVSNPEHEALEAEIDEENRRLYPGDYDCGDDYDDGDYDDGDDHVGWELDDAYRNDTDR